MILVLIIHYQREPCQPPTFTPKSLLLSVKPGIYGLVFTMGKWFLTDYSATVGRFLMIFRHTPILILIRVKKNQPSSTGASAF